MLPETSAAVVLLAGTIGFGSFHTWPYGFWYWTFEVIWKRYYGIEGYWPEGEEQPRRLRSLSRRAKAKTVGVLHFSLVILLPLLLAFDGILHLAHVFYAPSLSFESPYDSYFQVVGIAVIVISLLTLTWADSFLARYVYGTPPDQRVLIRTGPYRYVRHSVYLSFIVFGIGVVLLSLSYLLLVTLGYLLFLANGYRTEDEQEMLRRYGGEYEEYVQSTGAFLPKLSTLIQRQ